MSRFAPTFTAAPGDIDELGHVNNAVWVQWIQDVALAHWHSVASAEHRDMYIWVITRHEIDYLRALTVGGSVAARTWVGEATRGAKFDRYVEFTGETGRVFVRAKTTWAIVERATGRAIRVPPEVVAPFLADRSEHAPRSPR